MRRTLHDAPPLPANEEPFFHNASSTPGTSSLPWHGFGFPTVTPTSSANTRANVVQFADATPTPKTASHVAPPRMVQFSMPRGTDITPHTMQDVSSEARRSNPSGDSVRDAANRRSTSYTPGRRSTLYTPGRHSTFQTAGRRSTLYPQSEMVSFEIKTSQSEFVVDPRATRKLKFAMLLVCFLCVVIVAVVVYSLSKRGSRKFSANAAKVVVLTWNQGSTVDTSKLLHWVQTRTDADVAVVCQQETTRRLGIPAGWEIVLKDIMRGSTKPPLMAHLFLTVLRRTSSNIGVHIPKNEHARTSFNGKGGIWAQIKLTTQGHCGSFVAVCTHLPTHTEEREDAVVKIFSDIAKDLVPKTSSAALPDDACNVHDKGHEGVPNKKCWDSLQGIFIVGDMNYKLDSRLQHPQLADYAFVDWLKKSVSKRRWQKMLQTDTMQKCGLLTTEAGFQCNKPNYPPTYKVIDAHTCEEGAVAPCLFPEGKEIKKFGDEVKFGWLDRLCWHGHLDLLEDTYLYNMTGESDHVPLHFLFSFRHFSGECSER